MASSTEAVTANDMVIQAETIVEKVNRDWKESVKSAISRSIEKSPNSTFVYLISATWLDQWKAMSGYEDLNEGLSVNISKLNVSKQLPKLNEELVDEFMTKNLSKISKYSPALTYLDIVLKKNMTEDDDFVYAHEELWSYFKRWYPDSIEIRRKAYINSHHEISFEINLHTANFYFYTSKFIKFGMKEQMKEPPKIIVQISSLMSYRDFFDAIISMLRKSEDFMPQLKPDFPSSIGLGSFQAFFLKEGPDQAKDIEKAVKMELQSNDTLVLKNAIVVDKNIQKINLTLKEGGLHLEGSCAFIIEVKKWDNYYFEVEEENGSDSDDYFNNKKSSQTTDLAKKERYLTSIRKDSDSSNLNQYKPDDSKMGVVGLKNLGNTCYMNSALQCLSNCKELSEYFLKGDYKQDRNPDNVLGSKCKLVEAYAGLVNKMWYGEDDKVSPYDFKYEMGNFQSAVSDFDKV